MCALQCTVFAQCVFLQNIAPFLPHPPSPSGFFLSAAAVTPPPSCFRLLVVPFVRHRRKHRSALLAYHIYSVVLTGLVSSHLIATWRFFGVHPGLGMGHWP
eukprot:3345978-Rhodomonas_salina.1